MEDNLPLTDKLEFEVQTDILTLLENVKCQSSNTPVLKQALCALATICNSNASAQDYFRTVGGIDLLTDMLLKGMCPKPALGSTLFCLASAVNQNVLSQNVILNEDLMLLIHSVLTKKDSFSNNVKAAAFLLSCTIDGNGKGQWLAKSTECLHDLINLIKHLIIEKCSEDDKWAILSRAIGVCVNNPQNLTNQQVCCCVLPHILKFISTNPDHASMHHVLSLVCFILANNAFNQERIYQCGGVSILVNFIKHYMRNSNQTQSTNTITNAVAALDNCISDNEKGCMQAEDLGLVTLLLELLYDREHGQNYSQIIVLTIGHVLEYSKESCSLVSQGQGFQLLVSYLTETQDDELFKAIKYVFSLCKVEDPERQCYRENPQSNFHKTNDSEYLKCQLSHTDSKHQHMPEQNKGIQSTSSVALNGVQDLIELIFETYKNTASESSNVTADTFKHPGKSTTKSNFCENVETSQCTGKIAFPKGKSHLNMTIEASDVTEHTFLHPGKCVTNVKIDKVATSKCQREIANHKGKCHLNTTIEAEPRASNKHCCPTERNVDTKSCMSQCTSSSLHHLNIKPNMVKHCNHTYCPQCGNKCQTAQEHENLSIHSHQPVYAKKPSSAQKIIHYPEEEDSDEQAAVTNHRHQLPRMDKSCFNQRGHCCVEERVGYEASKEQSRGSLNQIPDFSSSRSHLLVDNLENVSVIRTMHENILAENPSETLTAYQDKKITDIVENVVSTLFKTLTESLQQTSSFAELTLASKVNKENSSDDDGLPCKAPTILSVHDYQSKDNAHTKSTNNNHYAKLLGGPCDESIEQTGYREIGKQKATPQPMSKVFTPINHSSFNQRQYCSSSKAQCNQQLQSLKENKLVFKPPPDCSRSNCSYVQRLRPNVRISSKRHNISDFIDQTRRQDPPQNGPPKSPQNGPPKLPQNGPPKSSQNGPPKSPQNIPPDSPQNSPPSPALSDWDSLLVEKARNKENVCLSELHPNTGCYSSTFNNGIINIVTHGSDSKNIQNQIHYYKDKRETPESSRDLHMYSFISETDKSSMSHGGNANKRRRRIPYTKEEVKNLLTGVSKMGKSWKQILCSYKFHPVRTSVDLKEKYKRLMAGQGDDES